MPTYVYKFIDTGEVDAGSSEEAISKVRAMGNFPTKIKERAAGAKSKTGAKPADCAASNSGTIVPSMPKRFCEMRACRTSLSSSTPL